MRVGLDTQKACDVRYVQAMEKASTKRRKPVEATRVAFVAPSDLVTRFNTLAGRRERTLSAELRKLMADELKREELDLGKDAA